MTAKFRADVESEAENVVDRGAARVRRGRPRPTSRPASRLGRHRRRDGLDSAGDRSGREPVRRLRAGRDEPARPLRLGPAADAHAGRACIAASRSSGCRRSSPRIARRLRISSPRRRCRPRGREAVLTVPLASRQREIEREIDELNRGVLVGAVLVVLVRRGARRVARGPRLRSGRAAHAGDAADRRGPARRAPRRRHGRRAAAGWSTTSTAWPRRSSRSAPSWRATNQLKAWNEMARQVAHEIKNPLTPIQLAAEHLQRVHDDQGRPLGAVVRSVRATRSSVRCGCCGRSRRSSRTSPASRRRRLEPRRRPPRWSRTSSTRTALGLAGQRSRFASTSRRPAGRVGPIARCSRAR